MIIGPRSKATNSSLPLVTIVTPSLNQGRFIERTILSVLHQDYPNIQYIVIDGGSSDETIKILKKHSQHIDYYVSERDSGQSNAINKGFSHARGDILAWLNSDDCYASPYVVSEAVRTLQSDPSLDLVYGRRKTIDENGFFLWFHSFRQFNVDQLKQADYLPQESCFWTREIWVKSGGFVNEEFDFAMDYELWFRFLDKGAKFKSINKFFGLFRHYQNQKTIDLWKKRGLPEIAKLQEWYLGFAVDAHEMGEIFMDHYSGFDRRKDKKNHFRFFRMWSLFHQYASYPQGVAPLDQWVFLDR